MKIFKLVSYLVALVTVFCLSGQHTPAENTLSIVALLGGMGYAPTLLMGVCAELTAFRTAVESLDQRVLRSPRLGRANFWRNMVPRGTFMKNVGVTRSTFQIKASEPQDNQALWQAITLSAGIPTPACDTNYEDVGVGYYERTWSPKQRRFEGPVICKADLTYLHEPEQFLNDYVDEMGRYMARVWEFSLRADMLSFANWYVDGVKYAGPNALATLPMAFQGISQSNLNLMATGQINVGAGSDPDGGYTVLGPNGPIFPLEIDMNDSEQVLTANSQIRDDARFAAMGHDSKADFGLWRAIGCERVIGNYRHVPTNISPRFNFTGGVYVGVSPFKDVSVVGTDGVILTDAYINAAYHVAIQFTPQAFTAEIVLPTDWRWPNSQNYNGEWEFEIGGYRICNPARFDPEGELGRHFAKLVYAAKPEHPYLAAAYMYKFCKPTTNLIFCS